MFRSIWSKTLRDYRVAILSWGIGLGLFLLSTFATFGTQMGSASAQSGIEQLAQTFRFLGDPIAITTAAGFTTWRLLNLFNPLLLCIWTVLVGAALLRRDEERASLDLLLSTPRSRTRVLLEKLVALLLALILIAVLTALCILAGESVAKVPLDAGRALLTALNVSLLAFFFGTLALLLSQFTNRGGAAAWAGAILTLSVLFDATGRSIENGVWLQRFSPFYYYNLNKPLLTDYSYNIWGPLLLLGLALLLTGCSIALFASRDVGGFALPAFLQRQGTRHAGNRAHVLQRAWNNAFTHSIFAQAFRAQLIPACWWLLSLVLYTTWMTMLTPSMLEPIRKIMGNSPLIQNLFNGHDLATNAGFLAYTVFQLGALLVLSFALTRALRWPSDLDDGRLELVLGTPKSRQRILLERFAVVLLAAILAPVLLWLTVLISARIVDLSIDTNKVAAASLGILPMELIIIAFVYALAERVQASLILGLASVYLTLAFLIELLRSLFNLPEWVMSLSIFHVYGTPISEGWRWGPFGAMLGVAVILLVVGIVQFRQSDIARGA